MTTPDWKEEVPSNYRSYARAAEKGPMHLFIKIFLLIIMISVLTGAVGYAFGWFGEAAHVAKREFGASAALDKYQWFVEQSKSIHKMDTDITNFRKRQGAVKDQYKGYGDDMSKWPPHIQAQYNKDYGQARDDLVAVISQRNNLVKDYNAASSKFNWSLFETKSDKPSSKFEELTE